MRHQHTSAGLLMEHGWGNQFPVTVNKLPQTQRLKKKHTHTDLLFHCVEGQKSEQGLMGLKSQRQLHCSPPPGSWVNPCLAFQFAEMPPPSGSWTHHCVCFHCPVFSFHIFPPPSCKDPMVFTLGRSKIHVVRRSFKQRRQILLSDHRQQGKELSPLPICAQVTRHFRRRRRDQEGGIWEWLQQSQGN